MSSSPLKKAGAVTSGQLEQNLNQRSPGNLYNGHAGSINSDTRPTLLELEAIVEKGLSDTRRLYKLYRLAVH